MILNAYAVVDALLVLLRLVLSASAVALGVATLWRLRRPQSPELRQRIEDRSYLLFLLATVLCGLLAISWPVFYLLLQSYVPQWRGTMCIYGVTQVGRGSHGASAWLPGLVQTLQGTKPLLAFLAGAWLVLYFLDRRTRTAPLRRRSLVVLTAIGLVGVGDASAELAYLGIPKKEEFLSVGCCSPASKSATQNARLVPSSIADSVDRRWWWGTYYGSQLVLAATLVGAMLTSSVDAVRKWLIGLFPLALVSVPIAALFLTEVAAPAILRLPLHHCPYDLLPKAPESTVGVILFVAGLFGVGWACLAVCCGDVPATRSFLLDQVKRLLRLALFGYVGSCVTMSVELLLASFE